MLTKGSGLLGKWKSVECPTCQAPAGANCVTVGARGTDKGQAMSTSVHNARKALATGGEVIQGKVYHFKPTRKVTIASLRKAAKKAGRPSKKSLAAKKAWETRRSSAPKRAALTKLPSEPSVLEKPKTTITLEVLAGKALEILDCGATQVTLELEGIGKVYADRSHIKRFDYQLLVKKP